jgi:ribosome-associated heat shock protein Hsp15
VTKKIRIDKWLWTVRIYKSRTQATAACKSGRVKIGEKNLKPSYLITIGEAIEVRKNGFNLQFIVKDILKSRVSATLAAPCYDNLTPQAELDKYKSWFVGKAAAEQRLKGAGRPTKKERREIEDYKVEQYFDFFDDEDDS